MMKINQVAIWIIAINLTIQTANLLISPAKAQISAQAVTIVGQQQPLWVKIIPS